MIDLHTHILPGMDDGPKSLTDAMALVERAAIQGVDHIALTSHFGTEGMYFVFDVTESAPIYVNLDRSPTLNSCIEMYLAPSWVTSNSGNSYFEIDLLPTGELSFKQTDGKYRYVKVATTADNGRNTRINTSPCQIFIVIGHVFVAVALIVMAMD